jgi:hypothetical protein
MTEAEWLACTDPQVLLRFLKGRASDRKLRLTLWGWSRLNWKWILDGEFHGHRPKRVLVKVIGE